MSYTFPEHMTMRHLLFPLLLFVACGPPRWSVTDDFPSWELVCLVDGRTVAYGKFLTREAVVRDGVHYFFLRPTLANEAFVRLDQQGQGHVELNLFSRGPGEVWDTGGSPGDFDFDPMWSYLAWSPDNDSGGVSLNWGGVTPRGKEGWYHVIGPGHLVSQGWKKARGRLIEAKEPAILTTTPCEARRTEDPDGFLDKPTCEQTIEHCELSLVKSQWSSGGCSGDEADAINPWGAVGG